MTDKNISPSTSRVEKPAPEKRLRGHTANARALMKLKASILAELEKAKDPAVRELLADLMGWPAAGSNEKPSS